MSTDPTSRVEADLDREQEREPDPRRLRALRDALLDWFAVHRRDLPWRRTSDPYAIWISEAMLQQTRVETVIEYWKRFLKRFPTVSDLAAAEEQDVLAAWSGLGYYRRARALHAAARAVVASGSASVVTFPETRAGWLALPGVGRYTAGAVLSIAYGRHEPLVDGNVARVFARWFELEEPPASPALDRRLWALAARMVDATSRQRGSERGPGVWNQALMELGATVCLPSAPLCLVCPVREHCRARAAGRVEELPRKAPKAVPIDVELEIALVRRRGRCLMQRRPEKGRMAGLWELPTREVVRDDEPSLLFPRGFAPVADARGALWGSVELGAPVGELRHGITRHRIRATVRQGQVRRGGARPLEGFPPLVWVPEGELADLALTGMAKKALAR